MVARVQAVAIFWLLVGLCGADLPTDLPIGSLGGLSQSASGEPFPLKSCIPDLKGPDPCEALQTFLDCLNGMIVPTANSVITT